ncbi:hypothetical protein [Nitratireductor sp. GCM10026969]|uniref:hypothetical protein n=1 Tax=Nitratireductor sp. GCM10026969 TaxID=3252645 RepID=UPI00360B6F31
MLYEAKFETPVYVKPHRGGGVAIEICNAVQGIDFLAEFPIDGEPIMEAALEACVAATQEPILSKHAEATFLKFAKAYGVLAFEPVPTFSIPTASQHRSFH